MQIPAAAVACLVVASVAAVFLAVLWPPRRRMVVGLRRRADTADAELAVLRGRLSEAERREQMMWAEIGHLAKTRMPALARNSRHPHIRVPGPLQPELAGGAAGATLDTVLDQATRAILDERARIDGAAQSAMRGATTKLQTMCYQMQTAVDELLHKYDDPDLAEKLAALDYLNEQILRRLQATRVVCGAGAGLVRTKTLLPDLVLGASSRIPSYDRVRIDNHLPRAVAVADRAAESVAVVVAELLANAVHHSHGSLPVEVGLHQAHNGAVVVVNDAGIGMNADEFGKARRLLTGEAKVFLSELGDPPATGFAAIGQLCKQFGFKVSVEPSHYAGIKAVLFIPGDLLHAVSGDAPRSLITPSPAPTGAAPHLPTAPVPYVPAPPTMRTASSQSPASMAPLGFAPASFGSPVAPSAPMAPVPPAEAPPTAWPVSQAPAPEAVDDPHAADPAAEAEAGGTLSGLPQRRHRRPERSGRHAAQSPPPPDMYHRDPEDAASRMGALQRGTARGRAEIGEEPAATPADDADQSERDSR
ncbi:ATP-binding protein [Streptomyces hainanensis]|uniref:histidine kinase n=1 Tax=Streptomyces hainanensis TaxID=402648 RepID=A0A4R4TPI0_9ACTN|nr:ATP-binding protein [Streptomyces hainanensis]TDC79971.1 sensor histidine kinase [Streptomyces hainanensis]